AFWLFPESGGVGGSRAARISSRSNDRFEIGIGSASGIISFYDGAWKSTITTASLNDWTHIAITWDGTSIRTYKNGVLSSAVAGGRALTGDQFFGARANDVEGYHGIVDEVRLFDYNLAGSEIAKLTSAGPTRGKNISYDMGSLLP